MAVLNFRLGVEGTGDRAGGALLVGQMHSTTMSRLELNAGERVCQDGVGAGRGPLDNVVQMCSERAHVRSFRVSFL